MLISLNGVPTICLKKRFCRWLQLFLKNSQAVSWFSRCELALRGGEIDLSPEEYIHLIKEVAQLYQPDYIDFEYYSYKDVFEEMLDFPNLVLSYHNFQETPENMMEILSELTSLNPKLVKVAVMAHTEQDVLDLMNYTRGFKTLNPEQEYVTISMGKVGKVSRITADVTGSSWSFASLDEASAPGQISLANMKKNQGDFG